MLQADEPIRIQALISESANEALGKGILDRLPWPDEWGGMSIIDTKPVILPPAQHSISGHKLLATGSPA